MTSPAPSLERVRSAVGSRYEVERQLSAGPGTALFLGQDRSLRRRVAIKVIERGMADDALPIRFSRETRILAGISHPNIVSIHDMGEREGLLYHVRDFPAGEPLSDRLLRNPLPSGEAMRLALDLLDAIGTAQRAGVIHFDLRPESIIALPKGFVLTSWGDDPTADGEARSEVYRTGAILYLALTGRVWSGTPSQGRGEWAGVPARLRPPLQRALATYAGERWPDAQSFAQALEKVGARPIPRSPMRAAIAAIALLFGAWVWWPAKARAPAPIPRELAIVPFEAADGSNDGADLAHLVQLNLDNLPGLSLTSARRVNRWWDRRGRVPVAGEKAKAARELRAHWVAHGLVEPQGDTLRVRITLYEAGGRVTPLPEVRAHRADLGGLSDTLALTLVRSIAPQLAGSYRVIGDLEGVPLTALRQFLQGDEAFQRDQWGLAEQHFEAALTVDSSFALAAWRLANVRSFRRLAAEDLAPVYQRPGAKLPPLDSLIIAALRQPSLRARLSQLELALARFPEDSYARLMYAEEVFHRGPLVGRKLADGAQAMADAIERDSLLALAYDHLLCASIRSGDRDQAKRLLVLRQSVASRPSPDDPDVLALSRLAYDERFAPARAALKRRVLSWTADSAQLDGVARLFRTGVSWFDIPQSQLALGTLLLSAGTPDSAQRASAHVGRGLALMALGRPAKATAELEIGLNLLGGPEASLEEAEWRIALPGFGLPLPEGGAAWKNELTALAGDSALGHRAAFALVLAAYFRSDSAGLAQWRARLRTGPVPAESMQRFAGAMSLAMSNRWREALALSDPLETAMNVAVRGSDPFARSAFHLLRGDWLLASADTTRAEQEWRWHENSDLVGWPSGFPQAGEIDGVLGVVSRLRRSRLLLRSSASPPDRSSGCAMVSRVVELWTGAEPAMDRLVQEARRLSGSCAA